MSQQQSAIVTGASSGIGMETALALAARGYNLALAARRQDRLTAVAQRCKEIAAASGQSIEVLALPIDVAVEEQVQGLVDRTVESFGRLDVMVNNAGYGIFARVEQMSDEEMRRIFDVNFFGVFYGARAAAKVMKRQRSGHIFNVSSVIGKRGTPFHGAYSATKFAICGMDDSMRVELRPFNVHVTTICPALTKTEFFDSSVHGSTAKSSFVRIKGMTEPSVVAHRIVRTIGRHKPEIVFTLGGKFLVLVSQLWPSLADRMMKIYYDDLAKSIKPDAL